MLIGLPWKPSNPAAMTRVRSWVITEAVMAMTGVGLVTGSARSLPPSFEFYWQPPGYGYDPVKARQLLADAGCPKGFDAGDYFCDAALAYAGEPVVKRRIISSVFMR